METRAQNDLIWTPQMMRAERLAPEPNGGSASVLPDPPVMQRDAI
jgi:hypothetical protein